MFKDNTLYLVHFLLLPEIYLICYVVYYMAYLCLQATAQQHVVSSASYRRRRVWRGPRQISV